MYTYRLFSATNNQSQCLILHPSCSYRSGHVRRTVDTISSSVPHHTSVVPMVVLQNNFHGAKRRPTKCINGQFIIILCISDRFIVY